MYEVMDPTLTPVEMCQWYIIKLSKIVASLESFGISIGFMIKIGEFGHLIIGFEHENRQLPTSSVWTNWNVNVFLIFNLFYFAYIMHEIQK